jgi:hypothetical protein
MKLFNGTGIIGLGLLMLALMVFAFGGSARGATAPGDSVFTPLMDYRGFADEARTPGGTEHAKMVYITNPQDIGSGGSGGDASNAHLDSIKAQVNRLIPYLTNIKSGLDSLWSISESNNITTALIDSVNHTNDSLLTTYTNWVQWSFSADSSYEVDFNKNFTNPKTFTAGTAYTTKPLPISGHDKLYMRKKSTSAGYMHRNLVSEGK